MYSLSLSKQATLVKNLRGVASLNTDEPGIDKSLLWPIRTFRYRDLGLTPSVGRKHRERITRVSDRNCVRMVNQFSFYIGILERVVEKDLVEMLNKEQSAGLTIVPLVYVPPGIE